MSSLARIAMVVALCAGTAAVPANAQTLLGVTRDWSAYEAKTPEGKVCYVLSRPKAILPTNVSRGSIYFLISVWPDRNVDGEVEVVPGYPYKDGEPVFARVGTTKVEFFTRNDGNGIAWAKDPAEEKQLIRAMRGGSRMIVTGESKRGTKTTDTYSLSGVTAALEAAQKACGK